MTTTTREQAIYNALETRHGISWSVEVMEYVENEMRTADWKDTARQIAKRIAAKVKK